MNVSPRYMLTLIPKVEQAMWDQLSSYANVEAYVRRWHEDDGNFWENFHIAYKEPDDRIDLSATLRGIQDDELLFKIAVDLGLEVPGLIYAIPEIKGIMASQYERAALTFENALKKAIEEPATSICCANSALESIIKHICDDPSIATCNPKATLYDLVQHILKEFKYYPCKEIEQEVRNIGTGLLKAAQNIEAMRSRHADVSHGKGKDDYVVDDPLYAKFIINAVTTLGLFLLAFYEKQYKPKQAAEPPSSDIPF